MNRFAGLLVLFALLLSGCAGPRVALMHKVRVDVRADQFEKAYESYRKGVKNTERVDELLNLGLLAFESGDYPAALSTLTEAERLAEERLTKSLSREAAGLAVSDIVRAYQGSEFDKAMLHYYRALGYLAQNDLSEATVEGRAIAHYLEVNARESKRTYKDDGFLQWFSGSLYESFGQINDAWISYKRAREIYTDYYGLSEPSFLCPVTLHAAREVADPPSETELAAECSDSGQSADWGRVIVLCEAGVAPPILDERVTLPIFKNDPHTFTDDAERERYARDVSLRRGADYRYEDRELDYLLTVALPYYHPDYVGSAVYSVAIRDSTDREVRAELVQSVGAILKKDLSDRYPAIMVRAIIRGIIKYAAAKGAEAAGKDESKTLGHIFKAIVNIAGAATEIADTRSWETLPDRIFAADFRLPPGEHNLRAVFESMFGQPLWRHDFPPVTVKKDETVYLRVRCTQ